MTVQTPSIFSSINWTFSSTIINAIFTVISGAILARILGPAAYGMLAVANLVVAFAGYFVRMGVGPAIIQNINLSSDDIDFAITFSMLVGGFAAIIVAILSPVVAAFFNQPESTLIIAVMGLSLWFTAFSASISGMLQRNMQFKQLSIINTAQILFSGLFSIIMAYSGFGVWSLVWPLIISRFLGMLAIIKIVNRIHPIKFRFSFTGHVHLLKFGTRYSFNSVLEYFGSNLDTISVGRLFSAIELGLYNRAYILAYLPAENLITSITSVMFPVFSRLQSNNEKFIEAQNSMFLFVGLLSTSIAMGMIPAAQEIIIILLGPKWLDAIPVLVIILFAVPFDFMAVTMAITFDATGKLSEKTKIQITVILVLLMGIFFLYPLGPVGIAIALTFSHIIRFILYILRNQKIFSLSYFKLFQNLTILFAAGITMFLASYLIAYQTKVWLTPAPVALFFEISICLVIYGSFLIASAPKLLGVKDLPQSYKKIQEFLILKRKKTT